MKCTLYILYIDWLLDVNGMDNATLKEVLIFFTGMDKIPLPMNPTLKFSDQNLYPTASTCVMELTLPSVHSDHGTFKEHLNVAFMQHGGFGLI